MLKASSARPQAVQARLRRRLRRSQDQPRLAVAMGCTQCPQFALCGGLHTTRQQFDCLAQCCQSPSTCTKVCRKNVAQYTAQVREIDNYALDTTPRVSGLGVASLPNFIPMLYHRGSRAGLFAAQAVALPLYALFDRRTGATRYLSRTELCRAYGLAHDTVIVLSGTDQDRPLENWWRYGEDRRRLAIATLRHLGIALVTTPNYSLFPLVPRWDDLHSMKRIAIIQSEFARWGVPAALHVNGRTERDFQRWGEYLLDRPEITHIAYEFGTGGGHPDRMPQHVAWLLDVARLAGRRLTLVVRGGLLALPSLASVFDIIFLDTDVFMRSMKRQGAVREGNTRLSWEQVPTAPGQPLDELFVRNTEQRAAFVRMFLATNSGAAAA